MKDYLGNELNNDTISVIEKLVFVYENLNILNNESIREHLDFAIKSIKNMEKEFDEVKAVVREVNPVFAEAIEAASYFEDEEG